MYNLEDIIGFVREKVGLDGVKANDDLLNDLGCWGDDHHEFMSAYSEKFNVDMNSYLWYFHTNEEGLNLGIFFRSPSERVEHMTITPKLLLELANKGKWI